MISSRCLIKSGPDPHTAEHLESSREMGSQRLITRTWYDGMEAKTAYVRNLCRDLGIASLILLPPFLLSWHNMTGDGAVYFTFIKNFFALPFSFQPDTVSFGATSPLHVVIHGIVYQLFGKDLWLYASKLLNFCFIVVGVVFLQRSIAANMTTLLIVAFVTTLNVELFRCTAQMYESSLAFCAMSSLYFLIKNRYLEPAVLLSGSLYLIRPELILITAIVDLYALVTYYSKKPGSIARCLILIVISMVPIVIYHLYMFIYTHELLPSSVVNKEIRALEVSSSWMQRVLAPIAALKSQYGLISFGYLTMDLIWFVGAFSIGVGIFIQRSMPCTKEDLMLLLPLVTLFTLFPAGAKPTIRYLLPATPVLIVIIAIAVQGHLGKLRDLLGQAGRSSWKRSWLHFVYLSVVLLAVATSSISYLRAFLHPTMDYNTALLWDLAQKLNPVTTKNDKILLYEIQGQYYLNASCYSLDCMVGSQLRNVLRGKDSLENYIARNGVGFLVTMNGLNYRKIFKNTPLVALYIHDLSSKLGDSITIGGITFKKVFTNPVFSDPQLFRWKKRERLNVGEALRVCGDWNKLWAGGHPMWNSVYSITKRTGFDKSAALQIRSVPTPMRSFH